MPVKYASLAERIIANTVIADSPEYWYNGSYCWLWIGAFDNAGYPKMGLRWKSGKKKGKARTAGAHRMAIVAFKNRRMTTKMVGKHLCNNTACCNPDHLLGGSQKSNVKQSVKQGRHGNAYRSPVRDEREQRAA